MSNTISFQYVITELSYQDLPYWILIYHTELNFTSLIFDVYFELPNYRNRILKRLNRILNAHPWRWARTCDTSHESFNLSTWTKHSEITRADILEGFALLHFKNYHTEKMLIVLINEHNFMRLHFHFPGGIITTEYFSIL